MGDPARIIGPRLKAQRTARGLTMRDLAEASSLAFNTISLIERGKMSPTIATPHKLTSALGVRLAHFVAEGPPKQVVFLESSTRGQAQ